MADSPTKVFNKSSCGRAMTCELTSSPTLAAAFEPASTVVIREQASVDAQLSMQDVSVAPSLATAERQALSGALRARLEDSPTLGSLIDLLDHTDAPHPPSQEETRA